MKILFISMELPYPDRSGGSKYAWQKIRQLSKENDIYLVSFNEENEKIEKKEYEKYVKKYYFYPRKKEWIKILLNIFKPYSLTSRVNYELQNKIKEILDTEEIDLILLDSIHMYYNIKNIKNNKPVYLTQQNIEYKLFETISKTSVNKIKKLIYRIEALKLKKLEYKLYKKNVFSGYIFISDNDMRNYIDEIGNINAICIPPSINIENILNKKSVNENIIMFSGKMNYEPNVTAVTWFVKKIFPEILNRIPDAKFYIVGKNPIEDVKKLQNDNIIVTGMVEDVKSYLLKAKIIVIPLLSGGGVKLKLFEALETDNIIITTSKGIEGTCFQNERDLYVEDDPKKFAQRCIENLINPNTLMVENAKQTIINNYTFEALQKILQRFIED